MKKDLQVYNQNRYFQFVSYAIDRFSKNKILNAGMTMSTNYQHICIFFLYDFYNFPGSVLISESDAGAEAF